MADMTDTPISDHTYDVITALQSKLEALSVYETFVEDCREAGDEEGVRVFEEIHRDDQRHAHMLTQELERLVQNGMFRESRRAA